MSQRKAAFAIPGDINTVTGGYIYERLLLENLRDLGHDVAHIQLGDSFPDPTPKDMANSVESLTSLEPERALIVDGLVYGSISTSGLAKVRSPIVAMIHHPLAMETGLEAVQRDHLFKTERDNLALAAHVLVPSPHTADILMSDYGVEKNRITIAQPGTDQITGKLDPSDPPLLLSVGIQHPRKGHDVLLRALGRLKHLEWTAVIVGKSHDADYPAELNQLSNELGLADRVTLMGGIPQEQLSDLYVQASVFALATRYEGYGMVFNEAMAWGLPIVSCDTGAVGQTVPETAGLLVPPDNPNEFAAAVSRLLTDSSLHSQMSQASTIAGRELPSWQNTARIASQVLNDLPL